ncbi:MAG: general stress protein [Kineosporiaceae bacterium]
MANFGPQPSRTRPPTMTLPTGQVIARYPTYALAQRAVDFLSDNKLPVQAVTIVGTDLRVVERVTGRLTYGRVAVQGALSGAWFGLLIGLLLNVASTAAGGVIPTAMLFGAGFGLLFGVISYAATRGRRDFTSRSEIVAGEYQVLCADSLVRQASEMLARLPVAGPGVDLPPPSVGPRPPASPTSPQPPAQGWLPPAPPSAPAVPPAGSTSGSDAPAPDLAPPTWPPADGAPAPRPTGPTYSEMIEKQKRERLERERAEREAAARAAREREAAAAPAPEPESGQVGHDHAPSPQD